MIKKNDTYKNMELNYKRSGVGEPLIILHGLFGMLDNWQSIANFFATSFEVFNIDLRNHGKSPHDEIHNYQVMARDIYEFLQDQNIFNTNIIGHSMGGMAAMQFAAIYPGWVKKLVVVDIFPKKYQPKEKADHLEILKAAGIIEKSAFKDIKTVQDVLYSYITDKRTYMFMLKNLIRKKDGTIGIKFNQKAIADNYSSLLESIEFTEPVNVPTLFLKGEKSNYISEKDFEGVGKYFTNAKMISIPEAGHWIHVDAPEVFKAEVWDFLK